MKKYFLILLIITTKICVAQNVGIGTLTPQARLHVTDSSVLFTGAAVLPAAAHNTPVSGAGTRMMWYPDKAAFRVGGVTQYVWDSGYIGKYSFAANSSTWAGGYGASSFGGSSIASGQFGFSTGQNTIASGAAATTMGVFTYASGPYSTTMGYQTRAKGISSVSLGSYTTASGDNAISMGVGTIAKSNSSLVAGQYNDTTDTNRLFEIGDGTFDNARHNALTVLTNGNTGIGTASPDFPLSFPTTYGEKVSIWGNPTIGRVGFAVQPSNFQMLTDAGTDITFGHGLSASATENMRIKYNGNVGIGTATPTHRLEVKSPTAEAMWIDGGNGAYVAFAENTVPKGFVGSFYGGADDFEIGTYGISEGTLNLTTYGQQRLSVLPNGNIGIGTTTPLARLHVKDSSVLFSAPLPLPTIANNPPASGNGNRMMWYADKAAFRAGGVDGNEWDKNNVGKFSFATGVSTTASGLASSAIGTYNFSTGDFSSTMGINAFAKAKNGVTLGAYNDISDNPNPALEATTDRIFQIGIGTTSPTRANALTILRNGNMGIGNTDPSFLLDISKRIRLRSENTTLGAGIWFNNNNNSAVNTFVGNDVGNNLQIYSAVGNRTIATFNPSSGGIRVEGPVSANSGNAIASFGGNGEFLVDKPGVVGGRFIIKENGNVGIGTNTPQAALDVAGYTVLGEQSAKIKMKKYSFFTNGFDGGISNFPLGFGSEKVLEVSIMIEASVGVFYPLNYTVENGYQVQYKLIGNAIQLRNILGNCANVLGKPIKINITYEE